MTRKEDLQAACRSMSISELDGEHYALSTRLSAIEAEIHRRFPGPAATQDDDLSVVASASTPEGVRAMLKALRDEGEA